MRKVAVLALLVTLLALAVVPALGQASQNAGAYFASRAAATNAEFTGLNAAIDAAGLRDTLNGEGPFTIFAPTDDAIIWLPPDPNINDFDDLLASGDYLTEYVQYHVVPGLYTAADLAEGLTLTTLSGAPISSSSRDDSLWINLTARVTNSVTVGNGIVHFIDQSLLPAFDVPDGQDLWAVVVDSNVWTEPFGTALPQQINRCQTGYVSGFDRGFFLIDTMGGWLPSVNLLDVSEDYGQPGGQPRLGDC